MRYFVHLAWRGTKYQGWQKHSGAVTIQGVLEQSLEKIFKTPVPLFGCGRTDAHVHASQFFFHMDIDRTWDFDLLFRLNKVLPDDIAVFDIIAMEGLPHARFDAISRSYSYFIHTQKDPLLSTRSSYYPLPGLDITAMKSAAQLLPQYKDFAAFCKSPSRNDHTICHVTQAGLVASPNGDQLCFSISSNRFLGKMIRSIVGRLLDIGTGKLTIQRFEDYLKHPNPNEEIFPAYPQGLYLTKVTYPYLDLKAKATFTPIIHST